MLVSDPRAPSISMLAVAFSLLTFGCSTSPTAQDRGQALHPVAQRHRDDVVLAMDGGAAAEMSFASPAPGLLFATDVAEARSKGKSRKAAKTAIAVDNGELDDTFATISALLHALPPAEPVDEQLNMRAGLRSKQH